MRACGADACAHGFGWRYRAGQRREAKASYFHGLFAPLRIMSVIFKFYSVCRIRGLGVQSTDFMTWADFVLIGPGFIDAPPLLLLDKRGRLLSTQACVV